MIHSVINKPLRVVEIFGSADGEVNRWGQGYPSLFIRLAGCNLKCEYCDTKHSQDPDAGREIPQHELLHIVSTSGYNKITITGGEPLLQAEPLYNFLGHLPAGIKVSVETNGSIALHHSFVHWPMGECCIVMDCKLPDVPGATIQNLARLRGTDHWVKFVIADWSNYLLARDLVRDLSCRIAFSPIQPGLDPKLLWEWMSEDRLYYVTLNMQLHKLIGLQ